MGWPEAVIAIVFILMFFTFAEAWIKARHKKIGSDEADALRGEVAQLRDRIKTLERIAIDSDDTLAREIEDLRDA